jgi:hypothetical protein
MPQQYLPGTNIQMDLQGGQDFRQTLNAAFAITGGIYLSQLADIVSVPGVTLQNWVKRGYLANPVGKRYTRRQTCRVILIAMLRHVMQLEEIAALLGAINHDLADEQDDLIDDSELYLYFCDIVLNMSPAAYFNTAWLQERIRAITLPFASANPAASADNIRLLNEVLLVMVLAYGAWQLREQAMSRINPIIRRELKE